MKRRINMARWQPHVEEARRRGVSLKAYAAEHGVSLYSLYRASQALREGDARQPKAPSGRFAAVRVVSAPAPGLLRVAAQLPNGVSLRECEQRYDCFAQCARPLDEVIRWPHRCRFLLF